MEQLINYKKRLSSRLIALEGEKAQYDIPESPQYIYSEKIDGHLAYAVVDSQGNTTFYNRSATPLDLPNLSVNFPKIEGIWAGELYLNKERCRSYHVSSAIVNAKDELCFAVFDALHIMELPTFERIEIIEKNIPKTTHIHPVDWLRTDKKSEIINYYNDLITQGKEGVVVHPQQGISYKLKPNTTLDLTVLGYSMKEDGSAIRSLLVGLYDGEKWMVVASVGGGFTDETRLEWLRKLEPMEVGCDVVMVAKNRLAYKWVNPSIVVEIKCLDIITEDASGNILKEIFTFANGMYRSLGKTSGVSLVSPVFYSERTDKKANETDTGINQITDRIELTPSEKEKIQVSPSSEVLLRQVYIKPGKNGTAVRKFVGLKTHKSDFPNYVLLYTDFSAGRKEPLQTEIKVASTQEHLEVLLQNLVDENIKKGWELA